MSTLREMAGAAPAQSGNQSGGSPGAGAAGGGGDDGGDEEVPQGLDTKKLYNNYRKLERLLTKQQGGTTALENELAGMKKKWEGLSSFFGHKEDPTPEGEPKPSLSQRAKAMHQRILDADPNSAGMPLTVDMAQLSEEAYNLVTGQSKKIQELEETVKRLQSPQFAAEGAFYVSLEQALLDGLEQLYGSPDLAQEHYPDLERLAIEHLKKKKSNVAEWRKMLTSPKLQTEFAEMLVKGRLPGGYIKKGAQPLEDEYTVEMALVDQNKAEELLRNPKTRREGSELMKKARRAILPSLLGVEMNGARR